MAITQNSAHSIQTSRGVTPRVAARGPEGSGANSSSTRAADRGTPFVNAELQSDPDSVSGRFCFIHGADIHYGGGAHVAQLEYDFATMERLSRRHNVRFYSCVGDFTSSGTVEHLEGLREILTSLDRPFYAQFGGHDGLAAMNQPKMGNYVDAMGPYCYSWNYGGVHFISLVSEPHFLSEEEQQQQKVWLSADLAVVTSETPVIVLTHVPGTISHTLADIAKSHNLLAVLQGHWHIHNLMNVGKIPVFTSGPWRSLDWGAFTRRVRIINLENGNLSSSTRVLGQDKRMIILWPIQNSHSGVPIAANIYDTVEVPDKVVYQISNKSGQQRSGQLTQMSDWTWMDTLKLDLPAGDYEISITATAGEQSWSARRALTMTAETARARAGNDWGSVLGPEQGGRRASGGACETRLCEPNLIWIQPTGTTGPYFSSPVVANERVYLGLSDSQAGYKRAGAICLDGAAGAKVWQSGLGGDVLGSVVAHKGYVCALTGQGELSCLDGLSGESIWRADVYSGTGLFRAGDYDFCMNMAPLTANSGLIYVAAQGTLLACYAVDTGELVWNNKETLSSTYQVAGMGIGDGKVVAVDQHRYVALDAGTGKEIWQKDIRRQRGTCTPIFSNGAVYLNYQKCLIKADSASGKTIWAVDTDSSFNYMGIPAVGNGIVVISKAEVVAALNELSGRTLWEFKIRSAAQADLGQYQVLTNGSSPGIFGDCVFVGGDDGYFYVLDLQTGKKKWEYRIGVPIKASPAISGNMVFVSAFDGNVYAFGFTISDAVGGRFLG